MGLIEVLKMLFVRDSDVRDFRKVPNTDIVKADNLREAFKIAIDDAKKPPLHPFFVDADDDRIVFPSITADQIQAGAITTDKLAAHSVMTFNCDGNIGIGRG